MPNLLNLLYVPRFWCQESEDYYDLRKTLPRFYRLFEHLNKGQGAAGTVTDSTFCRGLAGPQKGRKEENVVMPV